MRITITIDDALYAKALEFSDPSLNKPSKIFQEALKTYVRVQAARRLAALGGTSHEKLETINLDIINESQK